MTWAAKSGYFATNIPQTGHFSLAVSFSGGLSSAGAIEVDRNIAKK
jgi:hypothetical protein